MKRIYVLHVVFVYMCLCICVSLDVLACSLSVTLYILYAFSERELFHVPSFDPFKKVISYLANEASNCFEYIVYNSETIAFRGYCKNMLFSCFLSTYKIVLVLETYLNRVIASFCFLQ